MSVEHFNLAGGSAVAGPALDAVRRSLARAITARAIVAALGAALLLGAFGNLLIYFARGEGRPVVIVGILFTVASAGRAVVAMFQLNRLRRELESTMTQADLWWKYVRVGLWATKSRMPKLAYLYDRGSNAYPYGAVRPVANVGDIPTTPGIPVLVFGGGRPRSLALVVCDHGAVVGTPITLEAAWRYERRMSTLRARPAGLRGQARQ